MPYEIYVDSEKRPQVSVNADRVEKVDGCMIFYKGNEVVGSFREDKVVGYVKMSVTP